MPNSTASPAIGIQYLQAPVAPQAYRADRGMPFDGSARFHEGAARDLDVLQTELLEPAIKALGEAEPLAPLTANLEERKSRAYEAVGEALGSARYRHLLIDLCALAHADDIGKAPLRMRNPNFQVLISRWWNWRPARCPMRTASCSSAARGSRPFRRPSGTTFGSRSSAFAMPSISLAASSMGRRRRSSSRNWPGCRTI